MNEKPKRKLRWRLLRWALIGLAGLVTLMAVLVTEENWRGKRAWKNYKRTAEARGEKFDLASVVPPPVPDDQNFFAAPIIAEALQHSKSMDTDPTTPSTYRMNFRVYRGESELWPTNGGNWQKGKLIDLFEWQTYFKKYNHTPEGRTNGFPMSAQPQSPATDVLLALSVYDPVLAELRPASLRPHARIPLNYDNGFDSAGELLPWLAKMKGCAQFLQLRILAELEAGQGELALADEKLFLKVTDCVRQQPFLISHLVRIAMMAINLEPIYAGLSQHRWSDAQLNELELALSQEDFLADFEFSMKGEKVFAIQSIEKQKITREMISYSDLGTVTNSLRLAPRGFFDQSELNFAQMHEQVILPLVDTTNHLVFPDKLRQTLAAVESQMKHYSLYKVQAQMVLPAIAAGVKNFATIQAQVDLARVACTLERFRLANGNYPETLGALEPQFIAQLPHDILNGQPLHYRRTDDGKFVLYSVGWNEKDDGGQVVLTKSGRVDREKGDWVWKN